MAELILTQADIAADIEAYQARIQSARDKLAAMPADMATASTYKEQKRLKAQRRVLQDEINHVYRILAYAEAARLDCQEKKRGLG
jgi:predicted  nucleic acid-binding Zn-ribbon protein